MAASVLSGWAEAYAAAGWRPFPLVRGEKRPLYTGWQTTSSDPAVLERMFADERRNIGVACETFDAFDIEAEHVRALVKYMNAGGHSLPMTPVQNTGRGGLHILTKPLGIGGTRLYLDGVHIGELKSTGGFIVVSPSVTERQYTWRFAPAGMIVAEAPDWLRALVAPKPAFADKPVRRARTVEEAQRGLEALARVVAEAEAGGRNDVLFWAATRALEEGSSPRAVAVAMVAAATDCDLIRDDGIDSVEATLHSAIRTARS
jgi:hypothetical protein